MKRSRESYGSVLSRSKSRKPLGPKTSLRIEPLEDRRLLTLLGIVPDYPLSTYDSTGHIVYDPTSEDFTLTATPLKFRASPSSPQSNYTGAHLSITLVVDNSGNLVGGQPTDGGNDFLMTGTVNPGSGSVTGVLLTGTVNGFGFDETSEGTGSAFFDFEFTVTGGQLASYFAGQDIGITTDSEGSSFNDFNTAFTGGAKGNIGTTPIMETTTPGSISWEKRDTGGNLLGGATFTVTPDPTTGSGSMTVVDNGANDADPTPGSFQVANAIPGTYTVTETAAPAGYELDPTPTRTVMVANGQDAVIGTQGVDDPGETDNSDFHDPLVPTISTTQQPASATVGSSIADTATVSDGYNPSGTVTFNLYNNPSATGTPLFTDTEALSGGTATSAGYIASATGTDYWVATYNGDTNNPTATSDAASEPVTITPASPTIVTTQQPASVTVGGSIADLATVSGGYNPTGTVTFNLYNNPTASGAPLFTDTETLSGGTATSASYVASSTGTDYWVATYNGDSNNSSATSGAASEPVTVGASTPVIVTTQQPASITVGGSIADLATVSGGYSPTGTVTFKLYSNATATGTPLFTDTESLSGGTATSAGYTTVATGTDYWVAIYNGDSNNVSVTSPAASEPVTVGAATPVIVTTQQPASITVGGSIADLATVSGGYSPTGTVTFKLYSNATATGTPLFTDTEALSGGTATSAGYTTVATGTDYWVAIYNGDSNNVSVTSPAASEPVTVGASTPVIVTTQQPASITVGGSIADLATVSGGYSPTGTVTFKLYSNATATGTPLFTDTEALSGGTATSAGYTTVATGTDYWVAIYNGDSNNVSVTSPAASEPVTVGAATPVIVTTQQPASITVGGSIADLATVSGGYSPTGTVTFKLYSNATASGTPLFTDTESLSGGTATSAGYTTVATGTDYWVAIYNGDSNNVSVTSGAASEPVTVGASTPVIVTTQQPASITVGGSIADKATVSGGYSPTGTVTFKLYSNATATGTPLFTDTESLSGGTATSAGYTTVATGTDYWVAIYNGDSNNVSVTSPAASEPVTVGAATPVIVTTQQPASITVGGSIADKATVSGGYSPTGTVTFKLYSNATASGTPLFTDTESLSGGTATSAGYTTVATGTDYWVAIYNGDSNNVSVTSGAASEPVTVGAATPVIVTTQQPASITVGGSIADKATVSGGYSPTGTVTFKLYSNATASGTPLFTDTEALSGGTATSAGYTTVATGTDYWVAIYNGDSNNVSVTSGAASEPVTVGASTPVIVTTQQPASITVGGSIADKATVSGGYSPTGTVTFKLYSNATASGTPLFTDTETLSGGTATSASYVAAATGTDYWVATYNGDSNNASVVSGAAAEPVIVCAATPTIVTTQQPASITVGGSIADKATVSGGYSPTGTVTFKLYSNATATGTPLFTDTETLSGGTATSASYVAAATGTDYWVATYNGNSNNASVTSGAASEPVVVSAATPTIVTTQQPASITVGGSIADKATVSGGYSPTGTVTFKLYSNATASGTPLFTDTEALSGGTATSASYVAAATGTDYWVATYNGDSNNASVVSGAAAEPVIVCAATPTIVTTQQPASITVGGSIADKATVSGGYSPTGTVTFKLYSNATASGTPLFTDTETLSGGTATSASYVAAATGTDYWVATYNGNSNNSSVTSPAASEPVTVGAATPVIVTTQQPASITVGGSIADKATVSGGYSPTGTVTFKLYSNATASGTPLFTDTETLSGGTATSASYVAAATGTDYWVATYNGNSNNASVTSPAASEPVTVGAATPVIVTTQQPASITVGGSIADKATVSGGYSPTGTVTFKLYSNATASGTPLFTDTETLSGGAATSASYVAAATGTDYWVATYNGDSNNATVSSGVASEPVTVSPSSPTIVTTPGGTVAIGSFTISGTKYLDVTGNGFSTDDTPQSGVTINLYSGSAGGTLVASTTTASNGTYSFALTTAGTYYVQEVVPTGYIQTGGGPNGSAGSTYYTIVASAGHNYTANNFDDYLIPTCTPTSVSYKVTTPSNYSTTVSDLGGNTQQGDTVTVTFTVPAGMNDQLTLVSYYAPGSSFSDATANQQVIYQQATGTFAPGTHSLTVKIPNCYYQIDFFCGTAIGQLEPNQNNDAYGPDSANILYHAEDRYISSDNGGTTACNPMPSPTPATPPTSTPPATQPVTLTDSATLSGGSNPTGTITFYLFAPGVTPNGTDSNNVYSSTVTVSGDGTYNSGGYVPTTTGTYQWVAVYSGDSHNSGVASPFGSEPESVTSSIIISGTKFLDSTGNGFSSDDTPLSGVTINLYLSSNGSSGLQTGSGGDALVATTTTASNGTYSFTNLMPGTYYVQEVVPSGYIQTGGGPNGSAGSTYYTVTTTWNQTYGSNNFDDFQVPTCAPTNVCYTVDNNNCLTTVSSLGGNTQQGDKVTVTFTVPAGMNDQLSLVSYTAPGSSFNSATAYQQQIFDEATGIFTPGTHTLTVLIPNCYYQIDFVCGQAISELGPPNYGPDSSNIFYSAQSRLISSDNGGTQACSTQSVASGCYSTAGYWSTTAGKNVINCLNGSSSSTGLAQWLATNFPNLYGPGTGSHCLVNSNGSYFTNSQVVSAYGNFTGGDQQTLSAALSVYATSINLAGTNVHSVDSHFTTSLAGSGMQTYNVGVNGAAFGLANSTTLPVMQLLGYLNANTSTGAAVSSGANAVFSGVNTAGNVTNAVLTSDGLSYSPAQIRTAYGVNGVSLDGTGQTIAIVDAYDDPAIFQEVDTFDAQFGTTANGPTLYNQAGPASSFLTVLNQTGVPTSLPGTDPTGGWEVEEALDVEWAHAMAPGAQIVLVEADSQSLADLMASVQTAAAQPAVSVVSMSWGFAEGQAVMAQDEALYDSSLTTPAGHQGVTFVASTGDYGTADPEYPAFSPNVVAVGGTSLLVNSDSSYNSETGWGGYSDSVGAFVGSGGGISAFEAEPSYQLGVQSTGYRTTPDVSLVADPNTGVWIADSYNSPDNPWEVVGGTSVSAPAWAGLIALANQGRADAGAATLGSVAPNEAQQALYSLPQTDFNVIASGTNTPSGYSLVTGLGTPVANSLLADLASYQWSATSVLNNTAGVAPLNPSDAILAGSTPGSGSVINVVHNVFDVEFAGSDGLPAGANVSGGLPSSVLQAVREAAVDAPSLATASAFHATPSTWSSAGGFDASFAQVVSSPGTFTNSVTPMSQLGSQTAAQARGAFFGQFGGDQSLTQPNDGGVWESVPEEIGTHGFDLPGTLLAANGNEPASAAMAIEGRTAADSGLSLSSRPTEQTADSAAESRGPSDTGTSVERGQLSDAVFGSLDSSAGTILEDLAFPVLA